MTLGTQPRTFAVVWVSVDSRLEHHPAEDLPRQRRHRDRHYKTCQGPGCRIDMYLMLISNISVTMFLPILATFPLLAHVVIPQLRYLALIVHLLESLLANGGDLIIILIEVHGETLVVLFKAVSWVEAHEVRRGVADWLLEVVLEGSGGLSRIFRNEMCDGDVVACLVDRKHWD